MAINHRLLSSYPEVATRQDILDHAKVTKQYILRTLEERFDGVEASIGIKMSKVLETHHDKSLKEELDKRMKILARENENSHKRMEVYCDNKMRELSEANQKSLELMEERHNRQMEFMKNAYEEAINQLKTLLQSLQFPTPQVAITVPDIKAPDVIVNVPETQVSVHVPEQKAPEVTVNTPEVRVNLPELQAPIVNFEMPKRKVRKEIIYDEYGRPSSITENEE